MSIFNYLTYRDYTRNRLDEKRGMRSELAEHLGCQSGYISQVLQNLSDFSLEQGVKICTFFSLSEEESHYFILLLQHEKASTEDLKKYFKNQIIRITTERNEIKNRIKVDSRLNVEDYHQYYSSWEFAAVHVLTSIPAYQSKEKIRKKLKISHLRINEVLEFLLLKGLVEERQNKLVIGNKRIHLTKDSPFILSHHRNWRLYSIKTLSDKNPNDINFSGVFSISVDDIKKIREIVLSAIEKSEAVIVPSVEEELIYFGIDLNIFN